MLIAMDSIFNLETEHGWAFAQKYHTIMSAYTHDSIAVWYDILPLNGNTILSRALECAKHSQDKRVWDDLFPLVARFFKFSPQGDFSDFLYQVKQEENDAVSRIMPVLEACSPKHYDTIYANILPTPNNSIVFNGRVYMLLKSSTITQEDIHLYIKMETKSSCLITQHLCPYFQ